MRNVCRSWMGTGMISAMVALCAGAPGGLPAAADVCPLQPWPMYGHDPQHSGDACPAELDQHSVRRLAPLWLAPLSAPVSATPTVGDGLVFAGDAAGLFHALDAASGVTRWTFNVTTNGLHRDQHSVSYTEIASSAALVPTPSGDEVVFGGGGTVFALDAATGSPIWALDSDPGQPSGPAEVESSPVAWTSPGGVSEILVGFDTNGAAGAAEPGMLAVNALTGALLWKFIPETGMVTRDLVAGEGQGHGCGGVWSSPAVDGARGIVFFGTDDCAPGMTTEGIFAVDAASGAIDWQFHPRAANLQDLDFGSSPVLATVDGRDVVVTAGKDGVIYVLDRADGTIVWASQSAQPGEISPDSVGSIGGYIATPALGTVRGAPAAFAASAIPTPLAGDGVDQSGPPVVDGTLAGGSGRLVSLRAIELDNAAVLWRQPLEMPTYAAVTVSHDVVFAPSTTGFNVGAYDTATGRRLWTFSLPGAPSSGVSIAGSQIFFGSGTPEGSAGPASLPPQGDALWSFAPALASDG